MSTEKESQCNEEVLKETENKKEAEAPEDAQEDAQGACEVKEPEDDQNVKYLRLMADFQNYKRRSEKEKADIYVYANEKLVIELLDVMDNFERALSCETDASDSYAEGMLLIFQSLKAVMERAGLAEIEGLGVDFDPNVHHAVMIDAGTGYESGKVCDVIQKGYKLNNKVIRPGMVKVAE